MQDIISSLQATLATGLPRLLGAIGILIIGYIVALILRAVSNNLFDRTKFDEQLQRRMGGSPVSFSIKNIVGQILFWLTILFAVISALNILNLGAVAAPLDNVFRQILGFLPSLFAAAILAGIAWVVATLAYRILLRIMNASNWDERLTKNAQMEQRVPISQSLSNLVYYLIWFLFLPGILDALQLEGVIGPVERLLGDVLSFLPNLFSAAVILIIGYFVARVVRDIVTNLLASTGIDSFGTRFGFGDGSAAPAPASNVPGSTINAAENGRNSTSLSQIVGLIVYVFILIPVAISALDALNLAAISGPAIEMLQTVLNAIPSLVAAVALMVLAYYVARVVRDFAAQILEGIGLDRFLSDLGVVKMLPEGRAPSDLVGALILVAIMLFAATEAAELLGFESISLIIANFLGFLGNIVLGLIVLALGLYIANLADSMIRASGIQNKDTLASVCRYAILLLAGTMALRQMGIAEDIITLALGLSMGAIALAAAIAFGWGGREVAARQLKKIEAGMESSTE